MRPGVGFREYVEHYHEERNHQGIGTVIPFPRDALANEGKVRRRDRLGGLLPLPHAPKSG